MAFAAAQVVEGVSQRLRVETVEESLVESCRQGDEAAFRALYRNHRDSVHRIVFRLLGPNEDTEDIIQEVFIQVHRSIGRFQGKSKLSTWLHRVAVNVTYQYLRRKKTALPTRPDERIADRPDPCVARSPEGCAETNQRLAAVGRALETLSPKKRIVVVLHDMEGKSATEIAEIVSAPVFTVRTRLFYGRKELYRRLLGDPAFSGDISAAELARKR